MALTPAELLEKALNGESLDGDDAGQGDQGNQGNNDGAADGTGTGAGTVVDSTAQGDKGQTEQDKTRTEHADGEEPKGAPIASKSGNYTIPYERLETARERNKTLEGENQTLRAQLAELTTKQQANLGKAEDSAQARADAGQAQTTADQNLDVAKAAIAQGVDMSLFGSFTEEDIAKGITALVQRTRDELRAELMEESAKTLKPLRERDEKVAKEGHYGSIYDKHADADEVVQSSEFAAWKQSLPSFARSSVEAVFDPKTGGTAEQVIEIIDTFKAQTGKAAAPSAQDKGKGNAPEVQRRVPNSLSEAAGEQHQDVTQQVLASAGTNPNALMERMQDMSNEQIERLLNAV
ncbi:hypothetical protein KW843_22750 [Acidovorax sp. sif1233]|uniref:hypothetical protein n=1 Tax=Acidovorax sp. sif1233 TaxID=2854792 RepID=UPI001C4622AE|nr:hypothetical protein [Acidovorax sp. sif1233]MBV7457318.1 hypothetical protein [Acidovorax sp. sif1233]